MNRPISSGDMARVIDGLTGKDSPNIGLIVTVGQKIYECPKLGNIWRCQAEYAEVIRHGKSGCPPGYGDFAQSWLKRIEPDAPPAKTKQVAVSQ